MVVSPIGGAKTLLGGLLSSPDNSGAFTNHRAITSDYGRKSVLSMSLIASRVWQFDLTAVGRNKQFTVEDIGSLALDSRGVGSIP